MQTVYLAIFGIFFGYVLQRSRFCFAASFRDIFLLRNTALTRALIVALAVNTIGFTLAHFFSPTADLLINGRIYPFGVHTLVGGFLFGCGMVIAGSCATGCLVRLGEGILMQLGTFAGLLFGSLLGAWHLNWWLPVISTSPVLFLPELWGWPAAIIMQLLLFAVLFFFAVRYEGTRDVWSFFWSPAGSWSYGKGAIVLALTNTFYLILYQRTWGVSSGITNLAGGILGFFGVCVEHWRYFQQELSAEKSILFAHPLVCLVLAMILGAFLASLLHREFRIRRPRTKKYYYFAMLGGLMMGYGTRLASGCNVGALLSGISSFSLHGWIFSIAVFAGSYFGGKLLLRYLIE